MLIKEIYILDQHQKPAEVTAIKNFIDQIGHNSIT